MITVREPVLVNVDRHSSEPDKPYGVITADCSGAHEYDDALSVTPLPSDQELFQVQVFAVDTSRFYNDGTVIKRVLDRTESRYNGTGTDCESYQPMLDPDLTQSLHFAQGAVRKALVMSFVVGPQQPPDQLEISFGQVEVLRNYPYNVFGRKCRPGEQLKSYGRAAACILRHLDDSLGSDEETYRQVADVPLDAAWRRGSDMNQAYMVAANHLVGRMMRDEGRLAIYRAHDMDGDHLTDVLSPLIARYTTTPTPHNGLGLDTYCRVTSPLRRGEDFMMHGLLKARHQGKEVLPHELAKVIAMVRRLNQRVVTEQFNGTYSTSPDDKLIAHVRRRQRAQAS